jgi:carbon-monoxide dehydrogenase large subunit
MHAAIVETDPETAEITILKYAVVHDCGRLINPMIVEGQIQGGVAQGVGGALYERMAYDENGQLVNASFMDFLMPYVTEVPEHIDIDHLETPSPLNPLGIKGAGEAGVIPSAAVFAAAIEDAERHDRPGLAITAMPISPSELFDLRRHVVPPVTKTAAKATSKKKTGASTPTSAPKKAAPAKKATRARKESS